MSQVPEISPRDESRSTAHVDIVPGRRYGFLTDTTLCIGCKACEVACKVWNGLPAESGKLSGFSYDNTQRLSATTWRHVKFVEEFPGTQPSGGVGQSKPANRWLMMSDVCKHCVRAPCVEACPTGALFRTEFDTVVVQSDVCNGCGYCVPACPFGVVEIDEREGKAQKCTLCYDRLKSGLEPACSKACPTESIQFGEIEDLRRRAELRVRELDAHGTQASVYGAPEEPDAQSDPATLGGLNAFFILASRPETYNLPQRAQRASANVRPGLAAGAATAIVLGSIAAGIFASA
jgi:formate dehydrogenase iron-sulfur subunit